MTVWNNNDELRDKLLRDCNRIASSLPSLTMPLVHEVGRSEPG